MKDKLRYWISNATKSILEHSRLAMKAATFLSTQRNRSLRHQAEAKLRASGDYGDQVQQGPFKGIHYPPIEDWAGSRFEKVIGCYEIEIQPAIDQLIAEQRPYTEIVIAGAAEGYYVVGLGSRFPQAKIHAYEIQADRREFMDRFAALNDVKERLHSYGFCDPNALNQLSIGDRPLVVCDVEGYEETLMDPEAVDWLSRADIILELHDPYVPGIQDLIRSRFGATHRIELFSENGVPYNQFPLLDKLAMPEILALVGSERVSIQNWFILHRNPTENGTT